MRTLLVKFYSTYRKEPISSFILIVGVVDGVLGGFNESWSLVSLGVFLLLISASVRWLKIRKTENSFSANTSTRYLPPSRSQIPLPKLKKKNMID